jgi:hypothetical protein
MIRIPSRLPQGFSVPAEHRGHVGRGAAGRRQYTRHIIRYTIAMIHQEFNGFKSQRNELEPIEKTRRVGNT